MNICFNNYFELWIGKTGNPVIAYLKLAVSRSDVSCEDSARYRCQMEAIMADGSVKTYIKDTQISISGKCDYAVVELHDKNDDMNEYKANMNGIQVDYELSILQGRKLNYM